VYVFVIHLFALRLWDAWFNSLLSVDEYVCVSL